MTWPPLFAKSGTRPILTSGHSKAPTNVSTACHFLTSLTDARNQQIRSLIKRSPQILIFPATFPHPAGEPASYTNLHSISPVADCFGSSVRSLTTATAILLCRVQSAQGQRRTSGLHLKAANPPHLTSLTIFWTADSACSKSPRAHLSTGGTHPRCSARPAPGYSI